MHITIKCFATLNSFQPGDGENYPISQGETAADVIRRLGIDPEMVAVLFINGAHGPQDQALSDGDRVSLFPAVGGG